MPEPSKAAVSSPSSSTLAMLKVDLAGLGGNRLICVAQALNPNSTPKTIIARCREAFLPGILCLERNTFRSPATCWGFISILVHPLDPNNQTRQFWKEMIQFTFVSTPLKQFNISLWNNISLSSLQVKTQTYLLQVNKTGLFCSNDFPEEKKWKVYLLDRSKNAFLQFNHLITELFLPPTPQSPSPMPSRRAQMLPFKPCFNRERFSHLS